MTDNPKPERLSKTILAMIGAVAIICVAIIVFEPAILPIISNPTSTAKQPASTPPAQNVSQTSIVPTNTLNLVLTSTLTPTDTPVSTFTPTLTPANALINQRLPDLIVTGISDPTCTHDNRPDTLKAFIEFTVYVRNIGRARTYSFGRFSVNISLILGQRYYGLDEWASKFNGLIYNSNLTIFNLNPNSDIELKVGLDLKGNTTFGIEAIANSGSNPIPESDTTNNRYTQYFSIDCR